MVRRRECTCEEVGVLNIVEERNVCTWIRVRVFVKKGREVYALNC